MHTAEATVVPARTRQQRGEALDRANEVRIYRARLKDKIKAGVGGRDAMDVIAEPNELELTWKVFDLLLALPKWGRVKANRILARERISPSKTIGGLSDRQRKELLRALWAVPSARGGTVRP